MRVQSLNFGNSNVQEKSASRQKPKRYPWHAVASFCVPGTGQFIKGDKKRGKRDIWTQVGLFAGSIVGYAAIAASSSMKFSKLPLEKKVENLNNSKTPIGLAIISGVAGLGIFINKIQSAVNAYKAPPVEPEKK